MAKNEPRALEPLLGELGQSTRTLIETLLPASPPSALSDHLRSQHGVAILAAIAACEQADRRDASAALWELASYRSAESYPLEIVVRHAALRALLTFALRQRLTAPAGEPGRTP